MLALRWMGHRVSDEITAMVAVNRARSWGEFRAAIEGFAVPGQNMLYADVSRHIGRLMAVHLPDRRNVVANDISMPPDASYGWDAPISSALPSVTDPPEGTIVSANDRPADEAQHIGLHFSPPDRKQRLDRLLSAMDRVSLASAASVQRDTFWQAAHLQSHQTLRWLDIPNMPHLNARRRRFIQEIAAWNGCYDAASRGALASELLNHHLVRSLLAARHRAVYGAAWGTAACCGTTFSPQIRGGEFVPFVALGHSLALLPLIGRSWRFTNLPVGGGSDTLMKTAHALTSKRHASRYGSVARHISDLSDPDRNHFVLLGGQDGWLGSTTFLDQVPLWQRGDYLVLPLRPESARATFHNFTELMP
jgi:penicillin G amidase